MKDVGFQADVVLRRTNSLELRFVEILAIRQHVDWTCVLQLGVGDGLQLTRKFVGINRSVGSLSQMIFRRRLQKNDQRPGNRNDKNNHSERAHVVMSMKAPASFVQPEAALMRSSWISRRQ